MRNHALLAGIVLAIGVGAHFAFQLARAGQPGFIVWIAIPNVVIAVLGVLRAKRDGILFGSRSSFDEKGGSGWLSVRSGDFSRGFGAAALLFGLSWAFTKVVAPAGSDRESWLARLYLQLGDPSTLRKNVAVVVAVLIVMAIAEEIVWRGLVTTLLAEVVGSRRAWVWAAVLYAAAHVPTMWALRDPVAGANPVLPAAALACGLVWGFLARRFERLLPSIFSHVLFDWTVLMMFRLWGPSV
ncbi:MAG: CPBP family intramembrane metalloprotease [Deltaproteobacteria bacterium]|nr:CPBP family intramembrane metalloprotease [Deltaproteobacteria bacterium]